MSTYILTVILSYFFTIFLSNFVYNSGKKYNFLTHPNEKNLFPFPVLKKFVSSIILITTILIFSGTVYISPKFKTLFLQYKISFISFFIVITINALLCIFIKNRKIISLLMSIIATYSAYYNNILFSYSNNLYIKLSLTFLWFLLFFIIFLNERESSGTTFMMFGITCISLFFISFYLMQILSAHIFLILGLSILGIFSFTNYPPKILPGLRFNTWFSGVISYLALMNNLKFTICALLLFLPIVDIIMLKEKDKSFSFSLLKSGIPEKKVNFMIFILQIIIGIIAFSIITLKNEYISFLVTIVLFIAFYIFNLQRNKNEQK